MDGKTLTPSDPVSIFETNIKNLLGAALLFPAAALLLGAQRALEKRVSPEDKRTNLALAPYGPAGAEKILESGLARPPHWLHADGQTHRLDTNRSYRARRAQLGNQVFGFEPKATPRSSA